MLNVNELESRWLKYKIKSYIPYGVIIVSLGIILVVISTIYSSKTITKKVAQIEKKEIIAPQEQKTEKIVTKQIEQNITQIVKIAEPKVKIKIKSISDNKKILLSPSLEFMSSMKHNSISYYEEEDNTPVLTSNKLIEKEKVQKEIIQNTKVVETREVQKEITEKTSVRIKRQNTQEDISHVIKRFKKNNNPVLSLFVAKKYYELGEYHKSYNYALITNDINDNIDASWIIFAKSLVKLNEKEEAIKTLKKYIKHSHSSQAKILLEEIISGKFR